MIHDVCVEMVRAGAHVFSLNSLDVQDDQSKSASDISCMMLQGYWGRDRLDTLVEFPLEGLDMSPYVRSAAILNEGGLIYDLYGVVNHFGGSNFGHYTAYCKSPGDRKWHLFDDSTVSCVPQHAHHRA